MAPYRRWNDSRNDWDNLSTSGSSSGADPVVLTNQNQGTTTNQVNETTSYAAGVPSYQGGSTLQTLATQTVIETDPQSSCSDVTTQDSTVTTPDGQDSWEHPPTGRARAPAALPSTQT